MLPTRSPALLLPDNFPILNWPFIFYIRFLSFHLSLPLATPLLHDQFLCPPVKKIAPCLKQDGDYRRECHRFRDFDRNFIFITDHRRTRGEAPILFCLLCMSPSCIGLATVASIVMVHSRFYWLQRRIRLHRGPA